MCRFLAYLGHPVLIRDLVTDPEHSLIHQSFHARERPEPLNGDGFGVGWFAPEYSPRPAVFKDISPAWNNENLREIARVTSSRCILAHVRAASPDSSVQRLNCHPFSIGTLCFMHNGYLAGFPAWRRRLLSELSDEAFDCIKGSTDSEHAFALLWDFYRTNPIAEPGQRLLESLEQTIQRLEILRREAGVEDTSYFNFAVADGDCLVASRYCGCAPSEAPASLHYTTGTGFRCQDGKMQLESPAGDADVVLVASEETTPGFCWSVVPANHVLLARHPGKVEILSLEVLR